MDRLGQHANNFALEPVTVIIGHQKFVENNMT